MSAPPESGEGGAPPPLKPDQSLVIVIDDDDAMRESLADLFASVGHEVITYSSAQSFIENGVPDRPTCLVLDVRMPGQSGFDLQDRLRRARAPVSIVFLTGFADVVMSVKAMKGGAADFLVKPIRDQELIDAVEAALGREIGRRLLDQSAKELRILATALTPRELDVLRALDRGLLNKQIAFELGLSESTVKMHRSSAFRKLRASSPADLVRKVRDLGIFRLPPA